LAEKLSDDKKKAYLRMPLAELKKKAHEARILALITPALDKINEAWKVGF